MLRVVFCFIILFNVLFYFVEGETGCPPAEDIAPCKCDRNSGPSLTCTKIFNADTLLKVFQSSEGYTFQKVYIMSSAMLYIPVEIFLKTEIKELYIILSVFSKVFDESLELINIRNDNKHPYKMYMENVTITRSIFSTNFSSFTNLKEFEVRSCSFGYLPSQFSFSLPRGLDKLSFFDNGIKKINSGSLKQLEHLDKFSLEHNKVKNLTRDIFPNPFNARFITFDFNRIDSIPSNMFHDMPNLKVLSMKNNLITTIPESAFYGRVGNVPYFYFQGNPLHCDCKILYLIKDKPDVFGGDCTSPATFSGKSLRDLNPSEFEC